MGGKKAGKKFFADVMPHYVIKMRGCIANRVKFVTIIWRCDNAVRAFRVKGQRL